MISFSEIAIIAVIALLVLGPEKLTALSRHLGRFIHKIQKTTTNLQSDIEKHITLENNEQRAKQADKAYET